MKLIKISIVISTVIALSTSFIMTNNALAAKSMSFKVGANLAGYKSPNNRHCHIRVPKQYPSIQAGINAAMNGSTVCVAKGIYNENLVIDKPIRLSGSGYNKSNIHSNNIDANIPTIFIAGDGRAQNVIIEGFKITGADSFDINRNDPATLVIGPYTSGATLRYNRLEAGSSALAVRAESGQSNSDIYHNVFVGKNSPVLYKVSGVQGAGGTVNFTNNTFMGTVSNTTANFNGSGTVLDTWSTNSTIKRNDFITGGEISVLISSAYSSNIVTENNLSSKATYKLGNYWIGELSAENNWWGDLNPEFHIFRDVDFTPFATRPFGTF